MQRSRTYHFFFFTSLAPTCNLFAHLSGVFISLDQAKTFGQVEHRFLYSDLAALGLTRSFIDLLETLCTNLYSKLGRPTAAFPVTRGVKKGCPLSPLIFIISIDPSLHIIYER